MTNILNFIDFESVNMLLEGFNQTTGFVTAILDLEGHVLSKSGWRSVCTEFHRINPETAKRCTISDTHLAKKLSEGEKYHFYKCLNGLVDVAVPIIIKGEHIANLFSGQFFFEKPDLSFFQKQAKLFGFDEKRYLESIKKVPVLSKEKVKVAMDFLLNMTQLISEMTFQKLEQIELNNAIKESEEKFRTIFEHSPVGKSMTNIGGNLHVNNSFCEILGYSKEELNLKTWIDITHPEDVQLLTEKVKSLMEGEVEQVRFEIRFIHKNGSIVWADESIYLQRNKEGQPQYYITTMSDMTERKSAEENLAKTNKLLLDMIDNSPSLIYLVDTEGRFIMVNNEFEKTLGISRSEVIGKTRYRFLSDQIAAQHDLNDLEVIKSRKALSFEEVNIQPDGKHYFFTTKFPLIDNRDNLYGVSGISTDITNQKHVEELLKTSEENYRTIFEMSPIAAFFWDKEAKIIFWNKTAEKTFGWSKSEVIGKKFTEFFIPESSQKYVEENVDSLINNISVETAINENLRKDGKIIFCEWNNTIIYDKNGNPATIISLAKDITEQKRTEAQLKEQLEELRRWHEVTLGREDRIIDLKQEVNELLQEKGLEPKYNNPSINNLKEPKDNNHKK